MSNLADQRCVPCRGGVPPLEGEPLAKLSAQLPDWKVIDGHHLKKTFLFPDFKTALDFVNRAGAVAEAEGQLDAVRALRGGAIPDTDDLELPAEASGHADHHVVHERSGEAVQGAMLTLVVRPLDQDGRVLLAHRDVRWQCALELALGALDHDASGADRHVDA